MKKITDLKLVDWQQYLDQFVCEKPNKSDSPVTRRGPTHGVSAQPNANIRKIRDMKSGAHAGLCSEERSTISSNYARNFICDFLIVGWNAVVPQQLDMFDHN